MILVSAGTCDSFSKAAYIKYVLLVSDIIVTLIMWCRPNGFTTAKFPSTFGSSLAIANIAVILHHASFRNTWNHIKISYSMLQYINHHQSIIYNLLTLCEQFKSTHLWQVSVMFSRSMERRPRGATEIAFFRDWHILHSDHRTKNLSRTCSICRLVSHLSTS